MTTFPAHALMFRSWDHDDDGGDAGSPPIGTLVQRPTVAVGLDTRLEEARRMIADMNLDILVVMDSMERVYGVLTATDVLTLPDPDARVLDAMSHVPCSLVATTSIDVAITTLCATAASLAIVTNRAGDFLGIVTAREIVQYLVLAEGTGVHHGG